MRRVVAYIDGYNLYYGLRSKGWRKYYWLDIQAMARFLLKPNQTLVKTKYFTTIVKRPTGRHRRQAIFLEALQTLPNFEFFYGHFLSYKVVCRNCGHIHETYHEKMTDVNIAVELMTDAFQDQFDMALLVTADSDLVGPIEAVKRSFPRKRVIVVFPPNRVSKALKKHAHGFLSLARNTIAKSQFPERVVKPDGFVLHRPREWSGT